MANFIQEVEQDLYDVEARKLRNDEYTFNRQSKLKTPEQPVNYPDAKKHQIVYLKSWNEWAEGNYIEPDRKWGRKYLEVLRDEINNFNQNLK